MSTEHGSTGHHAGWAYSLDTSDDEARAALTADRVWNSFALADLRPPLREHTQVAVANHSRSGLAAACLIVRHPAFVVVSPYGVRDQSALVAIGGTHVMDETDGIAVLGNIFTHPAHRGRGHAHAITASLVSALLRRNCKDVVLNVLADNSPAIRVYRDLGFRVAHRYLTGEADRIA